jgi:Glycosyltransferase family 87
VTLGLLVVCLFLAAAVLAAASARVPSLVSTILLAYLGLVVGTVGATLALSPLEAVTRGGLAIAGGVLLAATLVLWLVRGRPGLPLGGARRSLAEIRASPLTVVFLVVAAAMLVYELVLGLTVPPNNWDSLWYHLPRAVAWLQHHGYGWIDNAPSNILNTRQPVAEQELLFLFAATGKASVYALPQFLAELAILVAVYGCARRLGFGAPASACSAALLATFSLVSLEASTAQNDLVAASFPVVAACLLLGSSRTEQALAGVALGIGAGVKLTTVFAWPVLALLAVARGVRPTVRLLGGAIVGLAAVGAWGYVLNLEHTGRLFGQGQLSLDVTTSPAYPQSAIAALDLLYESLDLGLLSDRRIHLLAVAGIVVGLGVAVWVWRRRGPRALGDGWRAAMPLLAPLLVVLGTTLVAWGSRQWGHPVRGKYGNLGGVNRTANEDSSAFGPIGIVAILAVSALTIFEAARRRADLRQLALALAFPVFFALASLYLVFNFFVTRFLLVPVALTAPLFARLFRGRAEIAAYLAAASIVGGLVIVHDRTKAIAAPGPAPWNTSQVRALEAAQVPRVAAAEAALERLLPPHACVGAILGRSEPAYLLAGKNFARKVVYISVNSEVVPAAQRAGLFYVVISNGQNRYAAEQFRQAGWKTRLLGRYWILASVPTATTGEC